MSYSFPPSTEKLLRATIMIWKGIKRFIKNKQPADPFMKTVKIFSPSTQDYMEFKMRLDTGCDIHNLISIQAIQRLSLSEEVSIYDEPICTCLNGEQLRSMGTLELRWKGKGFRKIFTTTFHVVTGDFLPWEAILGAETIQEHGILEFAGFGGASILTKMSKEEKASASMRRQKHKERAAANISEVEADIRAKEEAHRGAKSAVHQSRSSSSSDSSSSSSSQTALK